MSHAIYITHPDVVVDPAVPVPRWPLSERGRERMRCAIDWSWARDLETVFSSDEQKALDAAEILAAGTGAAHEVLPGLGENDRSATGFLPPEEFWPVVEAFFARPEESVRGWERAADAQARVVGAVREGCRRAGNRGRVAFVAHGGVGCLLLADLSGGVVSRDFEQPKPAPGSRAGAGGGYWFGFDPEAWLAEEGWRAIDAPERG